MSADRNPWLDEQTAVKILGDKALTGALVICPDGSRRVRLSDAARAARIPFWQASCAWNQYRLQEAADGVPPGAATAHSGADSVLAGAALGRRIPFSGQP